MFGVSVRIGTAPDSRITWSVHVVSADVELRVALPPPPPQPRPTPGSERRRGDRLRLPTQVELQTIDGRTTLLPLVNVAIRRAPALGTERRQPLLGMGEIHSLTTDTKARPMTDRRASRQTAGSLAAARWLSDLLVKSPKKEWHVDVKLDTHTIEAAQLWDAERDSRFHIYISSSEWGFIFSHASRISKIRVTDTVSVDTLDDFELVRRTPSLTRIGELIRAMEVNCRIEFQRDLALIETDLVEADPAVRRWVASL